MNSKDLINIGIFSTLYLVANIICSSLVIVPIMQIVMLPLAALICAPIYLLYIAKVGKKGSILALGLIYSTVSGLLVFGNVFCFLVNLIFFLFSEGIACIGKYKNEKLNNLSYMVAIFSTLGEVGILWYDFDYYYSVTVASGYSVEFAKGLEAFTSLRVFSLMVVATIICSLFSIWIAKRLFNKHFKKAGII